MSLGGLFILTDTPPALRELLRLEFTLPPHDAKLTVHAMTVNVSHRNDPEGRPPGAGLQLYAMDREAQKIWSSYIDYVRKTMGTPVRAARPPLVPSAPVAPSAAPPVTPAAAPAPPVPPPLPPAHTTPAAPPSATRPLPPTVINVPQPASPLIRPAPVQSVLAPPVPSMLAPPAHSVMAPPVAPSMVAPPVPSMVAPPMAPSMRSPGNPVIPAPPRVPATPFTPTLGPKAPPPHTSLTPSRVTATTPSGAPKIPFKPALHRAQGGFKPRAAGQTPASLSPHSPHTSKSTMVKVEIEPRSTETVFPVEDDGFVILR